MIFVIAGAVNGSGTLLANGGAGKDDASTCSTGDAAGGGGGGGTVVVHASTIESTVKIQADGGDGGNNSCTGGVNEVEGPGGGGGGGYIAVSGTVTGGTLALQANGGRAGKARADGALSEFQENGATAGHAGITNGSASSFFYCPDAVTGTTIGTPRPGNPTNDKTGDFTFSNPASGVTFECKITPPDVDFETCTSPFATDELADGAHTITVRAVDSYGNREADPPTYIWTVDTVAPVTDFSTKPLNPSSSAVGTFEFSPSEQPVTYQCQLDPPSLPLQEVNWVPCNAGTFANPDNDYSTPALGNGTHTLYVRATDAAGNVETSPPYWTWTLDVVSLDGGELDGGALDAEPVDVGTTLDTESPVLDTGPPDADARRDVPLDGPGDRPAERRDVAIIADIAPVIDTRIIDSTGEDGAFRDVGGRTDGPEVSGGDLPDTQQGGAEPGPDTAPVSGPEPSPDTAPANRDTAAPSPNADAASPPNNADAAETPTPPPPTYVKYMGGGFCTVSGARQASPLAFVLLALAGAAVLRRRRR
jgi:MYXO-CTERM domain-containing protein